MKNGKSIYQYALCVLIFYSAIFFAAIGVVTAEVYPAVRTFDPLTQDTQPEQEDQFNVGDRRWNGLAWEYYTPGFWKLNDVGERVWVKPQWSYYWVPESIWRSGYTDDRHTVYPGYWQGVKYINYNWVDPKRKNNGAFSPGHLQRYVEFRDPRVYN